MQPYLRLPAPHDRIVIVAPRLQDAADLCEILNDPRVYRWVSNPPFPYTMEDATSWLTRSKAEADAIWNELQQASGPPKFVGGCPVRSILEENADGSYTFLGTCGIDRNTYEDVMDIEERARLIHENNAWPVGDPNIIWDIGYYLRPSHHGRGIMAAVVGMVMQSWGIPRMNTYRVQGAVFEGNTGSVRVLEKNGFVLCKTVPECVHVSAKGEMPSELRTVQLMLWTPS